jgi:hypothetical protein
VVKVTTITGHEFEDLDYPDEEEGIEKLADAKGTFILWPRKDIIIKTHSLQIVSPWSTKVGGHSYFKHAKACSELPYMSDYSSCSRPSRPKALEDHREMDTFSFSRLSRPRAPR